MKKAFFPVILLFFALFATGCSTKTGADLTKAVAKMQDYKTYVQNTDVNLQVKLNYPLDAANKNVDADDSQFVRMYVDMFNNVNLKLKRLVDTNIQKEKYEVTCKANGITTNFDGYSDGNLVYYKLPIFSKYIKKDMLANSEFSTKEKYLEANKKINTLTTVFFKNYILNYQYVLSQVKDNGNVKYKAEDGYKEGREIQVAMDKEQFKDFIKGSVDKLVSDEEYKNLIIDCVKIFDEKNKIIEDDISDYVADSLESFKDEFESNIDDPFQYFDFNKEVVFKFYIDKEDNIARISFEIPLKIYCFPESKNNIEIMLSGSLDYSNINKASTIDFPQVKDTDVINYSSYTPDFYDVFDMPSDTFGIPIGIFGLPIEDLTVLPYKQIYDYYKSNVEYKKNNQETKENKKNSEFYFSKKYESVYKGLECTYSNIKGNYYSSSGREAEIKNGTVYVDADTVKAVLDATFEQNGNEIKFSSEGKSIKLYLNSKKAVINGKSIKNDILPYVVTKKVTDYFSEQTIDKKILMVPIRLVSKSLGAQVEWESDGEWGSTLIVKLP